MKYNLNNRDNENEISSYYILQLAYVLLREKNSTKKTIQIMNIAKQLRVA